MVGYLKPDFKKMPVGQKKEYKAFYCGLCKAIKREFGYLGISSLNYELTSFCILLSGLKTKPEKRFHGSCTISPFVPVAYVDYFKEDLICAANLSILIAHYKIKDNLQDDGGLKWNVINKLMKNKSKKSINALHDNIFQIDHAVSMYYKAEKNISSKFNDVLDADGILIEAFLSPLIKNYDMATEALLLELANLLGKWIYIVDACDDLRDDISDNNFNPLLLMDDLGDICAIIQSIETNISTIIRSLPLLCYQNLIEYIFVDNLKKVSENVLLKLTKSLNN